MSGFPAHTAAEHDVLAEVGFGWQAYERLEDQLSRPRGGVVIAVEPGGVDPTTGEIEERAFVTLRWSGRTGWERHALPARRADVTTLVLPDPFALRRLRRDICRDLGGRKGSVRPDELELTRLAGRLLEAEVPS